MRRPGKSSPVPSMMVSAIGPTPSHASLRDPTGPPERLFAFLQHDRQIVRRHRMRLQEVEPLRIGEARDLIQIANAPLRVLAAKECIEILVARRGVPALP